MQVSGSRTRFPAGTDTPITQAFEVRRIGGKAGVADEVACHVTGGPPMGLSHGAMGSTSRSVGVRRSRMSRLEGNTPFCHAFRHRQRPGRDRDGMARAGKREDQSNG